MKGGNYMRDYTQFMTWAVVYFVDRSSQDDKTSKLQVEALFSSPAQAEDNYIIQNDAKRYILHINDLEQFEKFYNHLQDLKEKYGANAIYHIGDKYFPQVDEMRYRNLLDAWQNLDSIA